MSDQLIDLLKTYGLPGWAVIVIGAGTVAAAIITAIQAVVVALINAWALRRVASFTAHRERRAEDVGNLRGELRQYIRFAIDIRRLRLARDPRQDNLREWAADAESRIRDEHQAYLSGEFEYLPKAVFGVWSTFWKAKVALGRAVSTVAEAPDETVARERLKAVDQAVNDLLGVGGAMESVIDGYVYGLRSMSLRTRGRLLTIRFRHWRAGDPWF